MKTYITLFLIALLASCQIKKNDVVKDSANTFYVGTYTDGKSEGIYKYLLKQNGSMQQVGLVAISKNPSFLALSNDKKNLIAVSEIADEQGHGSVESFSIADDSLLFLSRSSSGGAHPCFVAIDTLGNVLVANYTGGNIGYLQLNENGILSALLDIKQHSGKGTTDRQEGPHAHSAWFAPDGKTVIAVDLGTNELWFYTLQADSSKLIPTKQPKLAMAEGAGPRHLTFHPNKQWIYVLNELNNTITLVKQNQTGVYESISTITTLPSDFTEFSKSADIHISSDGNFVYASNRGHNSIAIYAVNTESGDLTSVAFEPTRGKEPRNFSLSPDENFVLVANQNSNNIISFKRNKDTGLLTYVSEIEAFKPVCVLFE